MKRIGLCLLAVLASALMFSGSALAQGDNSLFFVTYYSNNVSGAPDATVRFINDGSYNDEGFTNLWADFFVFDDSQELVACGSCEITPDGILSEDVKTELTNNPLTGRIPARGVIKVISDGTGILPRDLAPEVGLRGWATHIQRATPTSGVYVTTEAPMQDSNLTESETVMLLNLCAFAQQLGSGQGTITCTPEDHDF